MKEYIRNQIKRIDTSRSLAQQMADLNVIYAVLEERGYSIHDIGKTICTILAEEDNA